MSFSERTQESNLGGNALLTIVLKDSSFNLPAPTDGLLYCTQAYTSMQPDIAIPAPMETTSFVQTEENTDAGKRYKVLVKSLFVLLEASTSALLMSMGDAPVIVTCTDNNGTVRLLGDNEKGCRMTVTEDTGTKVPDRNAYHLEFFIEMEHPAYFYTA